MQQFLPSLDDMVFENRNKLYGAFELRKSYQNSLRKATIIGVAATLFVTGSSFVYFKSQPKDKLRVIDASPIYLPPPENKVSDVLPPPPLRQLPPVEKVIAYLPPVPVVDDLDFEEVVPPKVSDMENGHLGKSNIEGIAATAIVFDAPPPAFVITKEKVESGLKPDNLPFTHVEMMPEFVGGTSEMYSWLSKNLDYPTAAAQAGVEGKVFVKFIVEKDGTISKLEVLKGIGFGCDEEALRTLQKMPKWSLGKQNGRAVRVYFTLPIVFKLQ